MPFTHAEISAAIAVRSLVPPLAVEAIEMHHHPFDIEEDNLVAIVLATCDQVADLHQMNMFGPAGVTIETLGQSPEVRWLEKRGKNYDLTELAAEELSRSKEIFEVYFSNRQFK